MTALELVNALLMLDSKKDAEVVLEIAYVATDGEYDVKDVTITSEGKVRLEWG